MSAQANKNRTVTSPAKKETQKMSLSAHAPRRGLLVALAATVMLLVVAVVAAPVSAEFDFKEIDVAFTEQDRGFAGPPVAATQAGSHSFALTEYLSLNEKVDPAHGLVPDGSVKEIAVEQPVGFIGDVTAVPRCSTTDFLNVVSFLRIACPDRTALGFTAVRIGQNKAAVYVTVSLYNLPPVPGAPARIGFNILGVPIIADVGINQEQPYNVVGFSRSVPQPVNFFGAQLTLWGDPSDSSHDSLRGSCLNAPLSLSFTETPKYPSSGSCPTSSIDKPFLTTPGTCEGPLEMITEMTSWEDPTEWVRESVLTRDTAEPPNPQAFTGCGKLDFAPEVESRPSTNQAETGTGLDFNVDFDDEGLTSSGGLAESTAKKAVVTLPEGMTINPSIGEGLGVCTRADLERETLESVSGEGCPNASKIGTLSLETPLVEESTEGSVFLAQQDDPTTPEPGAENPFDSLIALYMVLRNTNLGVIVKLPLKVEPDPGSGRLVATLEDIPQLPFSHFNFQFKEGVRAALVTPSACGTYTTEAKFWPWANPESPRTLFSSFEITSGIGGTPCPSGGIPPFHPEFEAGSLNNNAGSFTPFNMRLIRRDGEQNMTKFSSVLPPGQIGSLAGVDKCPDAAVAIAKSKTGRQELASPSCPANALIGHTLAGAGVGSALTYVGGQIYLGGPYKGAPLSVIAITPAVAGPFDAGTVAVRLGLDLNPKTAEVEVDGAASDPIPHIIKGIVLKLRDLRVYVDRPNFTLNPTSCDESSAKATLFGSYLDVLNPADDVPVDLSTRYQAANCLNLGFKPRLKFNLKGGTKRGGHPGLKALYRPRKGDANLEGLVVRLPRSAFLDQAHIRTICTRVQFAADACPKGARYGYIRAWTPLLEEPLQGPVWLRSSNHKLPDLIFDLHGLVDIEVAIRIDSANGGIRANLEDSPDAPLSKVVLRMQGGKKGLIINSRNLCGAISRANVQFAGHNGKQSKASPVMRADGCGGKRKAKRHNR